MTKPHFVLVLLFVAGQVSAQNAEVPKVEAAPDAAPNALQPDPEKIGWLQGKLESLEEQYLETKGTVSSLSKLKVSGYIQARYVNSETSIDGLTSAGAPGTTDGFTVRRGRVKVQYSGTFAGFMLQTDATPSGVALKDAEATLTEPWSGKSMFTLTAGVTKWPFGYEITQSSGDREFPERTRVVRAFGPGERDRGAKLAFKYSIVRATLGLFDGNGTQNALGTNTVSGSSVTLNKISGGVDNDRAKDVVGRVGIDLQWLAAGVSGWAGSTFKPGQAAGNGFWYPRNRVGVDAQVYLDLLPFGGTAIKGEFIAGTTYQASNVEKFGQTALGWYALIVQNIGTHEQIAVRYDFWDPATGTPNVVDPADPTGLKPASTNQVQTIGFLITHHFDEVLKASLVYEIPLVLTSGTTDVAPNQKVLTVQLQAKF